MSDDLNLPEVPEPKLEDPEDVSWALSTAEAMWARGDHSEGIKWVRRAAEAASEAEDDERALELAKAAADLAGLISRPPAGPASVDLEDVVAAPPPPVPPARASLSPKAPAAKASLAPKQAPAAPIKPAVASRPPAPLPSQTAAAVTAPRASSAPRPVAAASASAPPPSSPASAEPATARAKAPASSAGSASRPPPSVRGSGKRSSRKSRENLDSEARAARGVGDTSRNRALDSDASLATLSGSAGFPAPPSSDTLLGNNEPTVIGNLNDLLKDGADTEDRQTVVGAVPTDLGATILSARHTDKGLRPMQSPAAFSASTNGRFGGSKAPVGALLERTAPAGVPSVRASAAPPARTPTEQHDPRIVTSQAVRVVVWRDANGIHVAPAGTVVSSITVDAVLVALEPNADLTAWLGGRERT